MQANGVETAIVANAGAADSARVLVVDDEDNIRDLLATALRYTGFEVETADSALAARQRAVSFLPELMLLDVMLPDEDGMALCRRLRDDGVKAPVIFLTAKDATEDKVRGLTVGGDDYITKPFSLEEVVARIRAVLRRTRETAEEDRRLRFDDLELDEDTHEVFRDGTSIALSPTEFKLLRYLLLNPERVLSKSQILDHVWQYDFDGDANVVETYISYLRKKIDRGGRPLLHTVRGVGYSLRLPRD